MGCWDTVCACCSVAVNAYYYLSDYDMHYHEWTCKIKAILRTDKGRKVYDCEEMMNYGGTGEFFANNKTIRFSVGEGWSEYPKGIVVHSDCLDLFISMYGPVLEESDKYYTGNEHLKRLWHMKTDRKCMYHRDDDYEKFRLISPVVSPENKTFIQHRLGK